MLKYCSPSLYSKPYISDIRVYENSRILNPVCLFTGIGFQIKFDASKFQSVKWEHSKRLIFGSMLCLSDDNFHNRILFVTVVKRDPKLLQEGIVTVKFEDDGNPFAIDPQTSFKMVESTAYFEAYRYILKRLQDLSKNPNKMPMKRYIVDCNYKEPLKVPGFFKLSGSRPIFNLKNVIKTDQPFDVTDLTKWPTAKTTGLDTSQLEALKSALTREVAVIQGPPGTGKTFIALKIAEAYLRNRHIWDPQRSAPIFVVCYTNHALDQFLQGILEIDGLQPNIIRIGGRSKNEAVSQCLLRERVQDARYDRSIPKNLFVPFQEARSQMNTSQLQIQKEISSCDAESKKKIIELSLLEDCIDARHCDHLLYGSLTAKGKEIEVWLGLWYPEEFEYPQQEDQKVKEIIDKEDDVESNEEDLIEVDNEAGVLQDERMIAGEEIELPNDFQSQTKMKESNIKQEKKTQNDWKLAQISEKKRKKLLYEGFKSKPMSTSEARSIGDIWKMTKKQRWSLYLNWVNECISKCKSKINREASDYNYACAEYNTAQQKIESHVAQKADVIGMTTTGAAKYHHLLDDLHPKIVLFEEAAEVLEAHLVTSIAPSVQQVILIGDHKQLRPKPTCYDLGKKCNLDISLFERLVEPKTNGRKVVAGGFPHVTLEVQHRMRPEISKLVHPTIYKKLIDADNVKCYDHVKGVSKDLFFITHPYPEEDNSFSDTRSHINKFEADYACQFCLYLLKQGCSPQKITILTMYRGQLLELKKRMKRDDFEGVRVAAVDDFQGEENEIIILSLVRSNSNNSIGFLSIENRVCVSLSRAKKGLYIIGDANMLKDRAETKWPEIIHYLEKEQCIGRYLTVYCQNHPENIKVITHPDDFKTRPEGGCQKICGTRLSCGHACPRICHIRDKDHDLTRCTNICNKQFSCGHFCKNKCYDCKKNEKCKPCSQMVEKKLSCHHNVQVYCSARIDHVSCPEECSEILPCLHKCRNRCSEPCTTRCKESVVKDLPCGHQSKAECFLNPEEISCLHPCNATLECGDICGGSCGSCKQGRLHVQCKQKCGRNLMCGHHCNFPCASTCPPCNRPCNNYCIHNTCPKKCYEPCETCMEPCEWNCPHFTCTKPCGQLCDRPPCNKPCKKILKCDHRCIGLCGERCPRRCRICNKDEVCEIFFGGEDEEDALYIELQDCGHILEVQGLDQWMQHDSSTSEEVKFKDCPKCTTSIRKSVRYGNHIKKVLKDVDAIKHKQKENSAFLIEHLRKALEEVNGLSNRDFVLNDIRAISHEIMNANQSPDSFRATAMKLQLSVLPKLLRLKNIAETYEASCIDILGYNPVTAIKNLLELKIFTMQKYLTTQQRSDILSEERRISCSIKLLDLYYKLTTRARSVSQTHLDSVSAGIKTLNLRKSSITQVTDDIEKKYIEMIKNLSEHYHVSGLSDEERIEIVAAIGLPKGHWYKCPNGHYYCIGECGGAMEESKCPECTTTIGGSNHALIAGNAHAGEMDNSSHAAWSDAANLLNLDPADLARLQL